MWLMTSRGGRGRNHPLILINPQIQPGLTLPCSGGFDKVISTGQGAPELAWRNSERYQVQLVEAVLVLGTYSLAFCS